MARWDPVRHGATLGSTPEGGTPPHYVHPDDLLAGDRVGSFKILERIGQGGMGNVYLADQTEPIRRRVAVKVMRPGIDTENTLARFETERQALALMNHPNIAKVFDAGVTAKGRPYFVMEHVPGRSITQHCDEHRLTTADRLELFSHVCDGVHHAHQKGVIHRDLKPSNILVTGTNGEGMPKIIDFGVAKATGQWLADHAAYTEVGRLVGTPEYMSPEQADPMSRDLDTRSDVYTLGIVLYEMLVGALPFDLRTQTDGDVRELPRRLLEEDPPKPSTRISSLGEDSNPIARCRRTTSPKLSRTLRGDLDWITMKALEREKSRRYQAASELAADIRRYLRREPVLAGPPTVRYRLAKFVRRHRVGAAFTTAIIGLVLAGIVGLSSLYLKAVEEREGKERQASKAESLRRLLEDMLTPKDPSSRQGYRDIRLADILEKTSADLHQDPPEDLEVRAEFHRILGRTYRFLGQYPQAERHIAAAYEIYENNFGFDSVDSLQVKLDWAIILDRIGNPEQAGRLFRQVYEKRREILDPSDPLVFDGARAVAINLRLQRRMEECRDFSELVVEQCARRLGADHVMTGHLMFTLGLALEELGELDESMEVMREVLRIYRLHLKDDAAQHVRARHGLAELHLRRGEVMECRNLMSEVLAIQERRFGKEHPITLAARTLVARAQLAQGERESAAASLADVLEAYTERGEQKGRLALLARHHLARAQLAVGDPDAAEATLRDGIQLAGSTGPEYPSILLASDLAVLLAEKGDEREAHSLLTRTWKRAAASPHLTVGEATAVAGTLAACKVRLGTHVERGVLEAALAAIDSKRAGELGEPALVLDGLIRLSESEGDEETADRYRARLSQIEQ